MRFKLILAILLMVGTAFAFSGPMTKPSDIVQAYKTVNIVKMPLQLSGISPDASKMIASTNPPLDLWEPMLMPNFGHYYSDYSIKNAFDVEIDENGVPKYLYKFADAINPIPRSVIMESGSIVPLNLSSIVYL